MHTKSEIFDSSPSNAHKINKKDIAIWHGQKELHDLNVVLTQSSRNAVLMPCDVVAYQVGRTLQVELNHLGWHNHVDEGPNDALMRTVYTGMQVR
jgi:hypothetical protein